MQELLSANSIDPKTQNYCFVMSCLFFVDFISVWFDQYSKYFAGNRFDKVSNILERVIQQLYNIKIVYIIVGILSEGYLMGQYMGFFHQNFYGVKPLFNENSCVLFIPCFMGLVFK
jgi:hypothetical protein